MQRQVNYLIMLKLINLYFTLIFDLQDDVDLINYMYDYENIVKAGASLYRNSNCTGRPNIYGHMLLDFVEKITFILSMVESVKIN
jgi:hypothetical protein